MVRRYLEAFADGSSGPPAPIFLSSVKLLLYSDLKEVLKLLKNGSLQNDDPAVKRLQEYLTEARLSLKVGIVEALATARKASLEEECGLRIRCFFEAEPFLGDVDVARSVILSLQWWLRNPAASENNEDLIDALEDLIEFNNGLDDSFAYDLMYRQ